MDTRVTYEAFKLVKEETIEELNSRALQFEHEGTGAEVLVLENDDDNKVFSITFRTPPENDRGVAHIVEHSVLCGSRKYPVKEPFMELIKGSLQTFLNAMTFPDKTMYPVASRNEKDFYNLMDVYLDAVFYPRLSEETFMQEGWRHDLETPEAEIIYKGIVFNEMKGVFSSPENVLDRHLAHSLFPDTAYGYESGGDPQVMPELTYGEFLDFHKRFYHPSNSRIFFYGNGNTRAYLDYLHNKFLKDFQRKTIDSSIGLQAGFKKPKRTVVPYPVSPDESLEKKTYIAVGMKLGEATDREHCLGFSILSYLLLGTAASPLRKALLDSQLGSEIIGGGFDDHRAETVFAVGLKGTEADREERILNLIFSTLQGLVDNGIEKDMIASAVNTIDFKLREANFGGYPKGIVYNIQSLGSWLYDADPLMHLKYEDLMEKVKREADNGYFESLIDRYLLNNPHQSILVTVPEPDLAKKQDEKVKNELSELIASLSSDQKQDLARKTQTLKEIQETPDSPEALATLPTLDLDDIQRESERFPIEIKNKQSPAILFHDLFTNDIAYTGIGFNTRAVPMDKIQYLPLFGRMILGMGTNRRDYVAMSQRIGIRSGGIRAWHYATAETANRHSVLSYVFFNGKALMGKVGDLFDIFNEVFIDFNFDNHKRLVEIIRSAKADMEDSIVPSGNHYVMSRLQSYQSRLGRYNEITDGIIYYKFLEDLLARAEEDPGEVAQRFKKVAGLIFTRQHLLVNITLEEKDYPKVETLVQSLTDNLSDQELAEAELDIEPVPGNEGFLTSSTVQYVGKGFNLYDLGFTHTGSFDVVKSLISSSLLWEKVRMKGGAYGCSNAFDQLTGDYCLVSYRDPNLTETLDVFDEIADYLENLDLSQEELTKSIIGCVGHLDPPLTPDRKGSVSLIEYLTGRTYEAKQKRRDELLATTLQDIKDFAPLFRELSKQGRVCVLGGEEKIKESSSIFDRLVKVFK